MTTLAESPVNYLNVRHTVASWLLTKDHKRIGILYMILVTTAFIIGAIFAAGVRLELATPAGDFVSSDTYNRLFTMHGVMMVFFVLIPAVPAILGRVRDWPRVLRDLIDRTPEDGAPSRTELLDHLTATMACKAAVKLGERLQPGEVASLLARRALADRSHLCPHGRPTALSFPASELERQFKR